MNDRADVIITHARVLTMDANRPRAEAVAVRGNRIVFVGGARDAQDWRAPHTRVIDAQQCTVLPGFIDSHFHLLLGSLELGDMQLGEIKTYDDLTRYVRDFVQANPDREWLAGYGLAYKILPDGRFLTRHDLDAIVADRPLIVFAYDTHTAWANSEALRRAGILQGGTTTRPNSEIVRETDGTANGELREPGAYDQVMDLIPKADDAQKRTLLRKGLAHAAQVGVTSVHNMDGDAEQIALYAALDDLGELTLRVYCPYSVRPDTPIEALKEAAELKRHYQSEMVRGGCVKFFMDGVIESYTALVFDDYADRAGCRGDTNFSAEHFTRMAVEADRLGLQIFVHAIGDAAVSRTLDGYQAAQHANGRRDSRHRVEHIELIHVDDLPRFKQLDVIASMQPLHAPMQAHGTDVWPQRVGIERWDRSFAWRSLREAGARLAFGSDWPVVVQNPLRGIHAALNRPPWAEGLIDHRQSLADTLASYTRDAAYAEFQESHKGRLHVGMLADMVLLSRDIEKTAVEEIEKIEVVVTMCDGKVVSDSPIA